MDFLMNVFSTNASLKTWKHSNYSVDKAEHDKLLSDFSHIYCHACRFCEAVERVKTMSAWQNAHTNNGDTLMLYKYNIPHNHHRFNSH